MRRRLALATMTDHDPPERPGPLPPPARRSRASRAPAAPYARVTDRVARGDGRRRAPGPGRRGAARIQNPRELSERVAFGKALWRELVIGFAAQLGELRLGFTQLAALYAIADGGTTTIADLADTLNRSPSATSRLVDGLVRRRLLERREEPDDRRMKSVWLTERGRALLGVIDRARADQFLAVVRPLPQAERAIVAMGVAALATRAVSRRGRLIKQRPL